LHSNVEFASEEENVNVAEFVAIVPDGPESIVVCGGVLSAPTVTPQRDWPMMTSPTAVGPRRYSCAALTVIEPSGFTTCSLKTKRKLSPTLLIVPVKLVLGAGLAGTGTIVSSPSTFGFPSEVWSVPLVIVAERATPVSETLQVLATLAAVNTSWPDVLTFWMLVELVTDPLAPVVPRALTVIGPELKTIAGPYCALPVGAVAVTGTAEPPAGSVTVGAGPRGLAGPPKRLTLLK
jgi:hypothetical protein